MRLAAAVFVAVVGREGGFTASVETFPTGAACRLVGTSVFRGVLPRGSTGFPGTFSVVEPFKAARLTLSSAFIVSSLVPAFGVLLVPLELAGF